MFCSQGYAEKKAAAPLLLGLALILIGTLAGAQQASNTSVLAQECSDSDPSDNCSHNRMLREGDNVYQVYILYNQYKDGAVKDMLGANLSADNFTELTRQRICSSKDGDYPDGAAKCAARVHRDSLDAIVRARKNISDAGKARTELLVGVDNPNASGGGAGSTNKDTVLTDLVKDAGSDNDDPKAKIYQMLAVPNSVDFKINSGMGNAVTGPGAIETVINRDEHSINKSIDSADHDEAITHYDEGTGKTDTQLTKVVADAAKSFNSAQAADQQAMKAEIDDLTNPKSDKSVKPTDVCPTAYRKALQAIADANLKKNGPTTAGGQPGAPAKLSSINTLNVTMPTSDASAAQSVVHTAGSPSPPPPQSLDSVLKETASEIPTGPSPSH